MKREAYGQTPIGAGVQSTAIGQKRPVTFQQCIPDVDVKHMSKYKYYAADFATGIPREIYRGDAVATADFGIGDLWRAKKDGAWSQVDVEITLC